jgi:hypothetical protein
MSMIKGDPIEIQNFARRLLDFTKHTSENLSNLRAALDTMGDHAWNDHNYSTYKEYFDQVVAELHRSLSTFEDEQSQKLNALAQQYDQVKY